MPGGAEPLAPDRATLLAERGFGEAAAVELHDLGIEHVRAEAGVLVGVRAPQLVVHVERRNAIPERAEDVPETGRVRAARDEARDVAAGWNQLVLAHEPLDPLDPLAQLLHRPIVPLRRPESDT